MRVVLDTNVLMSAVFFGGAPEKVLRAWQAGRLELAVSPEIVEEYLATAAVLSARYPSIVLEPILALIAQNAGIRESQPLPDQVCSDPDDDKFLACALASRADYVISGDKALRKVSGYGNVLVVSPRQFIDQRLSDANDQD